MNKYKLRVQNTLIDFSMTTLENSADDVKARVEETIIKKLPLIMHTDNTTIIPHDLLNQSVITITEIKDE